MRGRQSGELADALRGYDGVIATIDAASGRALAQAQYLAGMDVNQSVKERCLRDPRYTVGPHPSFRGCRGWLQVRVPATPSTSIRA